MSKFYSQQLPVCKVIPPSSYGSRKFAWLSSGLLGWFTLCLAAILGWAIAFPVHADENCKTEDTLFREWCQKVSPLSSSYGAPVSCSDSCVIIFVSERAKYDAFKKGCESFGGKLDTDKWIADWSYTCSWVGNPTQNQKQPPQANFTFSPSEGPTPLTVALDGKGSTDDGSITGYQWSTSDGKTASGPTASFVFDKEGSYTITLTVTDNDGLTASTQHSVIVKGSKFEVVSVTSKYGENSYFLWGINHNVTYTADISWGKHEPSFVRFETMTGSYDIPTTGATAEKTLDMGFEFTKCGKIKVTAFDKDSNQSETHEINANVAGPLPGVGTPFLQLIEEGNSFSYKGNLGITSDLLDLQADAEEAIHQGQVDKFWKDLLGLPPMFDKDTKFEAKFEPKVTTEITSEGKATFDFDVGEAGISTERLLKGKVIGLGFALSPKLSVASKFDCSSDKWQWEQSSLGISGKVSVNPPPWYIVVPVGPVPVPLYAKLSATVSSDGTINFKMEPDLFKPESGKVDVGVSGKGTVGAGVSDIVGVEGSVSVGGNVIWVFNPQPSVDEIKGSIQGGMAVYLTVWKWEPELPLKWEWSKKGTKSGGEGWRYLATGRPVKAILIPRDYLNQPNYATFRSSTRNLRDTTPAPVQTVVFPYSDADTSGNNNALYATWLSDNSARSAVNRTQVVFSTWNGTDWTNPQPIADDGTADFHPKILAFGDNSALATWEDVKTTLADTAQLEDMLQAMEISVSSYNPQTQQWTGTQRLTNNAFMDRSPKLAGKTTGNAIVTWISNAANDILGSADKPNQLWYARYANNSWNTPQQVANIPYPILKYNTVFDGQNGYVVLSVDTDGDLTTIADHELFQLTFTNGVWSALTRLTTDTVADDNPQLGLDPNGQVVLTWLKNNEISSVVNFDLNTRTVVRTDDSGYSSNLADFKLAQATDGKLAIVWAEPSAEHSSDLHALFYNPISKLWGGLKQLTADSETEKRITATFFGTDTLVALYNRSQVGPPTFSTTGAQADVPVAVNTDLYMLKHTIRESDFNADTTTGTTETVPVGSCGNTNETSYTVPLDRSGFYIIEATLPPDQRPGVWSLLIDSMSRAPLRSKTIGIPYAGGLHGGVVLREKGLSSSWIGFSLAWPESVKIKATDSLKNLSSFKLEVVKQTEKGWASVYGPVDALSEQVHSTNRLDAGFYAIVVTSKPDSPRGQLGISIDGQSLWGAVTGGWLDHTGGNYSAFLVGEPKQTADLKLLFCGSYGAGGAGEPTVQMLYQKADGSREVYWHAK